MNALIENGADIHAQLPKPMGSDLTYETMFFAVSPVTSQGMTVRQGK